MAIIKNTLTTTVLHFIANATTVVVGNNSVSNIAYVNTSGAIQDVASASIRKILCSSNSASGTWTVKRGANVVWIASGNFLYDFQAHGGNIDIDKTANVVVELTGGSGSILIELSKESVISS